MEIKENLPIVVFDDQCYLCMKFAKMIDFFARGKITMIGHYSDFGVKIRDEILDESALDMFWFINEKTAYGGRAALYPLMKMIISKKTGTSAVKITSCSEGCKTVKAVFMRSTSLFTNSKKINL